MNKALPYIIIAFVIIVAGAWIFSRPDQQPPFTAGNSDSKFGSVPDFTFEDYEGNSVSLTSFQGQPIIVNSWATWCPFCINELPDFVELQEELGDQVTIIAVDRSESLSQAKQYTDDLQITDDLVFVLDPSDSFYKSIGGFSMPETIFVDSDGTIQQHKRGFMRLDEMRSLTSSILNN